MRSVPRVDHYRDCVPLKEEVDEKRYLRGGREAAQSRLPLECGQARGVENRDFIREDRHSDRCWVTIAAFNSLYPEIAEATDLAATLVQYA